MRRSSSLSEPPHLIVVQQNNKSQSGSLQRGAFLMSGPFVRSAVLLLYQYFSPRAQVEHRLSLPRGPSDRRKVSRAVLAVVPLHHRPLPSVSDHLPRHNRYGRGGGRRAKEINSSDAEATTPPTINERSFEAKKYRYLHMMGSGCQHTAGGGGASSQRAEHRIAKKRRWTPLKTPQAQQK